MTANFSFFRLLSFLLVVFFIFSCQNDQNKDFTDVKPKKSLSADKLIAEMFANGQNENEMVVAVTGIVHEINYVNKRTTILLEGNKKKESYIICDMNANQTTRLKTLKKGDSILVKGLLKGVLKDVIMLNCVIANTE